MREAYRTASEIRRPAERPVGALAEKSRGDELRQHVGARCRIEAPQSAGLCQRERQPRHLTELAAHPFCNQGSRVLGEEIGLRSRADLKHAHPPKAINTVCSIR